jgi:hypothetical protein
MLRSYALAPETVRRLLQSSFWRFQIIAAASFLAFGLYLVSLARPVDWGVAGPMVGIVALAYFFIIFFNFRQQLRTFYSLRYEIDDSSITFRQIRQQPLHISRANIVSVEKRKNGLLIKTTDPGPGLFVPSGLAREGDNDFLTTLQTWVSVTAPDAQPNVRRWVWLFSLGGSFLVLLFANNLWIVLALGVFLFAFGIYTERRLNRYPSILPETTNMYNMAFSLLILVILMKSCLLGFSLIAPH